MRRLSALATILCLCLVRPALALAQEAPQTDAAPAPLRRAVFVHVDSPRPVNLQLRASDKRRRPFYSICTSPCDTYVPADGAYRIGGDGATDEGSDGNLRSFDVQPSRLFSLPSGAVREVITVEPSSQLAFVAGIALTVIGGVAIGLAGLAALANAFSSF